MTDKLQFDKNTATEYDRGIRRTLPTYDAMFRLVQAYFRANIARQEKILIIGAGGGNELAILGPANPEWKFTAVDPAPPMLELAKLKAEQLNMTDRVTFIEGTIDEVDVNLLHDAATFMLVLHFIADVDEKLQHLKGIRRRLKAGAPFVMATMYGDPDDPAFNELFSLWKAYWLDTTSMTKVEVDEMEKTVRNLSFIPEEEIFRLLQEAGFGNIAKFFSTNMFGGWICRAK